MRLLHAGKACSLQTAHDPSGLALVMCPEWLLGVRDAAKRPAR